MKILLLVYIIQYQYSAVVLSFSTQKSGDNCSGTIKLLPSGSDANYLGSPKKLDTQIINILEVEKRFSFKLDSCGGIGFSLRNIKGSELPHEVVVTEWSGEIDLDEAKHLYVYFEEIASIDNKMMMHIVIQGSTGIDLQSLYIFKASVNINNAVLFDMATFSKLSNQQKEENVSNKNLISNLTDEEIEKKEFPINTLAKTESIIANPDRNEPKSIDDKKNSRPILNVERNFKVFGSLPLTFVFNKQQFKHDRYCHLYQAMVLTKVGSYALTLLPSRKEREYHSILFTETKLI